MDDLATALLGMSWSDMDAFAQCVHVIATDDNGEQNDVRYIAEGLVGWAHDNKVT